MLFDHCHWSIQFHWMGLVSSLLVIPFTGQFGTGHNIYAAILELIIGPLQDFQDQEVQLGLKTVLALTNQLLGAALHQLAFYIITLLNLPMSLPPCSKTMWELELWLLLAPAVRQCTLGKLATENFGTCGGGAGAQLLTVGFNASAWMYSLLNMFSWHQAGTGWSHEIQMIFHHLASISQMPLQPYFVFDGLDCPQLKRGKDIMHPCYPPLLVQQLSRAIDGIWFQLAHGSGGGRDRTLPASSHAALVDVMVTLYNNALLFGADLHHSQQNCTGLKWGDLLLVMLMSSVDSEVASGAAQTLPIDCSWSLQSSSPGGANNICEVLQMDPQHLLGHRHHELACIIVEECIEFPDPTDLSNRVAIPPLPLVLFTVPWLVTRYHLVQIDGMLMLAQPCMHFCSCQGMLILSVPSLPLETPVDTDPSPAYEIEMPAVMLEYSRPNLVESTVNLPHETGVIDLVGGADAPHLKAGVTGLMDEDYSFA
ncbi:hypothetical protein F5J12DRAFT_783010 [Pisolithus orientalis]|uniref:uncharacterized protein n=1 Tax=Pisolithus orientalis TaxID=936130 RepID=UPI0022248785|nr:uncharacterized protein F5J12DRAFT_783010 [Pisolithus orientalis]KAI6006231.1 hypothetical protein F5J12DRAFT_783010 [Pisolithus orientalis]